MCIRNNQRQTEAHKIILEDIFLLSVGIRTRDNKRKYNREINEVLDLLMYEYTKENTYIQNQLGNSKQ